MKNCQTLLSEGHLIVQRYVDMVARSHAVLIESVVHCYRIYHEFVKENPDEFLKFVQDNFRKARTQRSKANDHVLLTIIKVVFINHLNDRDCRREMNQLCNSLIWLVRENVPLLDAHAHIEKMGGIAGCGNAFKIKYKGLKPRHKPVYTEPLSSNLVYADTEVEREIKSFGAGYHLILVKYEDDGSGTVIAGDNDQREVFRMLGRKAKLPNVA